MKNKQPIQLFNTGDKRGVSHVVGVVLLISLIVVIAAIILTYGTSLLGGVTASADASVNFQEISTDGSENANAVEVQISGVAENVNELHIEVESVDNENGTIVVEDPEAGQAIVAPDGNDKIDPGDRITVIAYSDETDQVVGSYVLPEPSEQRGVEAVTEDEGAGGISGEFGVS